MAITIKQYSQSLYEALHEANSKDHDRIIDNLVEVLRKNNDLSRFEEIVSAYEQLDLDGQGIKNAEVTIARESVLNKKLLDELNVVANAKLNITEKVDEEIIGGVVIKMDDTLIDASVRGQLNKLGQSLTE